MPRKNKKIGEAKKKDDEEVKNVEIKVQALKIEEKKENQSLGKNIQSAAVKAESTQSISLKSQNKDIMQPKHKSIGDNKKLDKQLDKPNIKLKESKPQDKKEIIEYGSDFPEIQRLNLQDVKHVESQNKLIVKDTQKVDLKTSYPRKNEFPAPVEHIPVTVTSFPAQQKPQIKVAGDTHKDDSKTADLHKNQPETTKELIPAAVNPFPARQKYKTNTGLRPPVRTGYGTLGRIIKLRANHVRLKISLANIHHYDIDITPEKIPKSLKRQVFQHMLEENKNSYFKNNTAFFDGAKNFYTVQRLPIPVQTDLVLQSKVEIDSRKLDYKCKIKYAVEVNMFQLQEFWEGKLNEMPQDPVQAIDVAMKHMSNLTQIPVGRSLYMPSTHLKDLGEGCELWMGRFQSVRPTQWKMTLNIDLAATAFYQSLPIIDFMTEFLKLRDIPATLNTYQKTALQKELKNLKVRVNHQGSVKRVYVVRELTNQPAKSLKFTVDRDEKKETMTVADYFLQHYNYRLKFPNLPCLRVGSLQKQIYLPMEVCEMKEGQKKNRVSDQMVANMIRFTARPAPEREAEIMKKLAEAKFNQDPIMKACGISVDDKLIELDGRVLEAPMVCYQGKQASKSTASIQPRMGVWDMRNGEKFVVPAVIKHWALVCFEDPRRCSENSMKEFFRQLGYHANTMGMSFSPDPLRINYARNESQLDGIFKDYIESSKAAGTELELIFVILPGRSYLYADVKRLGDVKYGIMTQCIQSKNLGRASPSLLVNICLKLNAKCDGTSGIVNFPQKTLLFKEPIIVFGADVTHPTPGDMKMPSIAAVVASMDCYPQKYTACVKAQGHRVEIIENLSEMMQILLKRFHKYTKAKPRKIIFYRDGVSEGQFLQVLQFEVMAIQEACRTIQRDYQPLITFAVVQKRHHTRLFCVNPRDACGKSQNVPPGTIVDRGIVHPRETDFFMCSHAGIQGTSRPTHYHILWDDNNFSQDEFQSLTYALCHTYVRCNRAVSIPAPAYYAHHVAFRARYHLAHLIHSDTASNTTHASSGDSSVPLSLERCNEAITIQPNNVQKMYFA